MAGIEEIRLQWLFIVPIHNLEFSPDTDREQKICRVTFIATDKFKLVRKRFGLQKRISELQTLQQEFFEKHKTLAIIHMKGAIEEVRPQCFKLVEKELNILLSSFIGYDKRSYKNKVGIVGHVSYGIIEHAFMSTDTELSMYNSDASNYKPRTVDTYWRKHQRKNFFFQFISMVNDRRSPQRGYKKELLKAVELMGKSFNSNDIVDAFLWNMIAIEILISKQGDKYRETLTARFTALFGWLDKWEKENYRDRIEKVYKKRSAYVHDGNMDAIEVEDLLITDELLLNIIRNIVKHPEVFTSKDALIDFTQKVEAEKTLGLPSKVHPRSFRYIRSHYTKDDLNMLR